MKKIGTVLFAGVLAGGMLLCTGVRSQDAFRSEPTMGRAAVVGGKVSDARARAIENAFENRVREETAGILAPSVLESDSAELGKEIFSRSREFISRYSIVGEYREGDSYIVEVEVLVSEDALRAALLSGGFIRERETGLIFLMVLEEIDGEVRTWWSSQPGDEGVPSSAEAFLSRVLKNQGYILVEPIPSQPRLDAARLAAEPDSPETLKAVADTYGAGVFIFGRAKAVPVESRPDTGTLVSAARLDIKITSLIDSSVIARFSGQARAEAENSAGAGALAVEQAAHGMIPEILARLDRYHPRSQTSEKGGVVIWVGNIYSYRVYRNLADTLPLVPGVQEVELWGFSPGKVKFIVQYQGEPLALANTLARKSFDEFKLTIVELDKDGIQLQVTPVRYLGPRP